MSKKVAPLAHKMANELQVILGAMEQGNYMTSLKACGRAETLVVQLRTEILECIGKEHQDDVAKHAAELAEIRKMMPFRGQTTT
jgi:hypothetical protein